MTLANMWFDGDWSGPGMLWGIFGMLAMIAFWVLIGVVIIKLVKSRPMTVGSASSGLRVLEERYARGEISRDEFIERRDTLMGRSAATGASDTGA